MLFFQKHLKVVFCWCSSSAHIWIVWDKKQEGKQKSKVCRLWQEAIGLTWKPVIILVEIPHEDDRLITKWMKSAKAVPYRFNRSDMNIKTCNTDLRMIFSLIGAIQKLIEKTDLQWKPIFHSSVWNRMMSFKSTWRPSSLRNSKHRVLQETYVKRWHTYQTKIRSKLW